MRLDEFTEIVIGLAIKIHRKLGPGLLESVYQAAMAYELFKNCRYSN
jgi:GxxExxY protein